MLLNRLIYAIPKRVQPILYKLIKWYYRKPRTVSYKDIQLELLPTVFHPTLYLTTETLLETVLELDISGKSLMELGCGSGLISLYLAKHNAINMYAVDINDQAIEGLKRNAERLGVSINCFSSNLFEMVPNILIDILIVNPPFFPLNTVSEDEYAFFAGEDFSYFKKLANALLLRKNRIGQTIMILTDQCELLTILSFFPPEKFKLRTIKKEMKLGENHIIYSIGCL